MEVEAPVAEVGGVRLHVVTGKGGTGKTTVAAALALSLATQGRRVLVAEVEGRQGLCQVLDVPPLPERETRLAGTAGGGELWGISVDAGAALVEYLALFYRLGRAGSVLRRTGAIDFATTVAPGVRDVLSIGKLYEAVRRTGAGRPVYDAVVLDAPPTGRVVRFLDVNHEVADLAKVGPIRRQAESITALLRSPECAVHVVTLLEEMPVQETVDTVADVRAHGLPVGAVLANRTREALLTPATAEALTDGRLDEATVAAELDTAGLAHDPASVRALLAEGRAHVEALALEDERLVRLDALDVPVLVLPEVVDPGGAPGVRELAAELGRQGLR